MDKILKIHKHWSISVLYTETPVTLAMIKESVKENKTTEEEQTYLGV